MGLNKDVTLNGEVNIENAYFKLTEVGFNELNKRIEYKFMAFKDEETRLKGLNKSLGLGFQRKFINFDDEYFVKIKKLYDEIRTLVYEHEELKNKAE